MTLPGDHLARTEPALGFCTAATSSGGDQVDRPPGTAT
jgi:hypothetical protein